MLRKTSVIKTLELYHSTIKTFSVEFLEPRRLLAFTMRRTSIVARAAETVLLFTQKNQHFQLRKSRFLQRHRSTSK